MNHLRILGKVLPPWRVEYNAKKKKKKNLTLKFEVKVNFRAGSLHVHIHVHMYFHEIEGVKLVYDFLSTLVRHTIEPKHQKRPWNAVVTKWQKKASRRGKCSRVASLLCPIRETGRRGKIERGTRSSNQVRWSRRFDRSVRVRGEEEGRAPLPHLHLSCIRARATTGARERSSPRRGEYFLRSKLVRGIRSLTFVGAAAFVARIGLGEKVKKEEGSVTKFFLFFFSAPLVLYGRSWNNVTTFARCRCCSTIFWIQFWISHLRRPGGARVRRVSMTQSDWLSPSLLIKWNNTTGVLANQIFHPLARSNSPFCKIRFPCQFVISQWK